MNPRDKRPGEKRTFGAGGRPAGAVWYVLGFLFLMALAQAYFLTPAGSQRLTNSPVYFTPEASSSSSSLGSSMRLVLKLRLPLTSLL